MPIIKPYPISSPPMPCRYSQKDGKECYAELTVQTPKGPVYTCKRHAGQVLSEDPSLLANALRAFLMQDSDSM